MCDWTPKLQGNSTQVVLKEIKDIHSWDQCQHECCKEEMCAAIIWWSFSLDCKLLAKPYQPLVGPGLYVPEGNDFMCKDGCVSNKVCKWTPVWEGNTPAKVIARYPNVPTVDECKHKCCLFGEQCKAISWHRFGKTADKNTWAIPGRPTTGDEPIRQDQLNPDWWGENVAHQCDLLGDFYDTHRYDGTFDPSLYYDQITRPDMQKQTTHAKFQLPGKPPQDPVVPADFDDVPYKWHAQPVFFIPTGSGRMVTNKWNGPLNPTCKWCIDSMPSMDANCAACKEHGLKADCQKCWDGFASLGAPCTECFPDMVNKKFTPETAKPPLGWNWHGVDIPQLTPWWFDALGPNGRWECPALDGIAPTCNQCIRGSGGMSMLPADSKCGMCARDPNHDGCEKCWDSLPQIFSDSKEIEQEFRIRTDCNIRHHTWDKSEETYCNGEEPLVSIGSLVTGATWTETVLMTAGLCEHLCRRWAFKMGGDQVCCSARDGEDYLPDPCGKFGLAPNAQLQATCDANIKRYVGDLNTAKCTAVDSMAAHIDPSSCGSPAFDASGNKQWSDEQIAAWDGSKCPDGSAGTKFVSGQQYLCRDLAHLDVHLMGGCWAKRNGYADIRTVNGVVGPPNSVDIINPKNPGQSRAVTCEGLGAYYDTSGDVIRVTKDWPAYKAGIRTGMRLTAVQIGDPAAPLLELVEPNRKMVYADGEGNLDEYGGNDLLKYTVNVKKTPGGKGYGGTGCTFRGTKVERVFPTQEGGCYAALNAGYPHDWNGKVTGDPSNANSLWNCKQGKNCLPALRRGARPGFIVRQVGDAPVVSQWDIEKAIEATPDGQTLSMTFQIDLQASLDVLFSSVSPDKQPGMGQVSAADPKHIKVIAGGDYNTVKIPPVDNPGFLVRAKVGPFKTPFQGWGTTPVGGSYVTDTGVIQMPYCPDPSNTKTCNNAAWQPLGEQCQENLPGPSGNTKATVSCGLPCESCVRHMIGLEALLGCVQGMCDWTPKSVAAGPPAPISKPGLPPGEANYKTIPNVHSWWECKKQCCMDLDCASLNWDAKGLQCHLYDRSYEYVFGGQALAPPKDDADCQANGCVTDKICEWTPMNEGHSSANVIYTVPGPVKSWDQCRHECCKYGGKCRAIAWSLELTGGAEVAKGWKCDLLGDYYDDDTLPDVPNLPAGGGWPEPMGLKDYGKPKRSFFNSGGGTFYSNKWNGPVNPSCKWCAEHIDAGKIDSDCAACKAKGEKADCEACWASFSDPAIVPPKCDTCWLVLNPFFSHLWGLPTPKLSEVPKGFPPAPAQAKEAQQARAEVTGEVMPAYAVFAAVGVAAVLLAVSRRRTTVKDEATYGTL
jgi:hypothetical protein